MKDIELFLKKLKSLSVQLQLRENDLQISAPKGVLTNEILTELKLYKEEIIKLLSNVVEDVKSNSIKKVDRNKNIPLSFSQQRMWFLNQLEGEKAIYHISFALKIEGNLNHEKLNYALNEIVKRHEIFRTLFPAEHGAPTQKIIQNYDVNIEYVDFRMQPEFNTPAILNKYLKDKIVIPFNLAEGPLFRSYVVQINEDSNIFLMVLHGIAADGWSASILFDELTTLYQYNKIEKYPLEELEIQFADFGVWQREQLESGAYESQLNYWKKQLEKIPTSLNFPFDYQRKKVHEFIGKKVEYSINSEITKKLSELINNAGVSPFMLLWGAYAYLLYKYTGQEDIVIGIPVANRTKSELEKLIGFFANTLVMRAKIDSNITFMEYLQQIKQTSLDAFANQDYPFDQLVEAIEPQRTLAHAPIFQTMFVLQNQPKNIEKETGLKISAIDIETNVAHFDLSFVVNEFDEQISGFLEINTSIIKVETAERLLEHYKNILKEVVSNPNILLGEIEIITEAEKEIIFNKWNTKLSEVTDNKNIIDLLNISAKINAEKDCIVFENTTVTYKEFNTRVNKFVNCFVAEGIKSGDVVGVLLNKSIDLIATVTAILKCGAAYLPIDPEYPSERIRTILDESKVRFFISNEESISQFTYINARNYKVLNKSEIVITNTREVIRDLDSLPLPDRGSVDYSKYSKYIGTGPVTSDISILSSRGCPYNCIYCHKIWPKKQITRSSENIFNEVKTYYDCGFRRFTFLDDIFNLRKDVSGKFFEMAIAKLPGSQFFFPNGLRADILTEEFIDLMVEAGTVDVALALESGSPRIQKLIHKNLNLEKFLANIKYFAEKHPHVFLELQTMFGFPTETEEEALMTLDTIKKVKWIDFPNLHVLKIFPNSEIYKLAIENGISEEAIRVSANLAYHALPETLPYPKSFARQFQSRFMNEYFLNKERLLKVLPTQFSIFTKKEMVQKYDSYLPYSINSFEDILKYTGVKIEELGDIEYVPDDKYEIEGINEKLRKYFPVQKPNKDAIRILLFDASNQFSSMHETMLHHQIEEPIGLMSILANLRKNFGNSVSGKVAKALVDFNSFEEMEKMIIDFNPHIIGFRTLSIYKNFFHRCISIAKNASPNSNIIVGGPYISSEYDKLLSDSNIDLAIIGEGEITVSEFIAEYINNGKRMPSEEKLRTIPGIAFMPKNEVEGIKRSGFDRNVLLLDYINENALSSEPINKKQGDLAYVLYTSGSTGTPKGVAMGRKGANNLINWHLSDIELSKPKRTLQFASISFDVSFQEIFSTIVSGGTLYLIDQNLRRDPYELLQFIKKNEIERIFLPVVALQQLAIAAIDNKLYPSSIKQIITAGEQLKITDQIRIFFSHLNNAILLNHYGPTESHVITSYLLDGDSFKWNNLPPIGKPVPNTNVFLLDSKFKPVPPGLRGELFLAGESLAEGYYNRPELTNERFINNEFLNARLYKTGDMGRYLGDGNIEYLGRADEQVKIRGYRVEPGEIEAVINKISGVQYSAVIPEVGKESVNYLVAYIQLDTNVENIVENGIVKVYLETNLPDYMIPAKFIKADKLPLNSNGKVDKPLLADLSVKSDRIVSLENTTEQEELLLGIWKDILNIENLGIDDDFFRSGGHSLLATQVVSRVRNLFNVDLQLKSMFEYPTIRSFSQYLSNENSTNKLSTEPLFSRRENIGDTKISYNQKFFWDLDKIYVGKNVNSITGVYKISGEFVPEKFIESIDKIVAKYETLRVVFFEKDGDVYQRVTKKDKAVEYEDISSKNISNINLIIENATNEICMKPFDLNNETTSRFKLIKTSNEEYLLLYAIHHIAFDGWSLGIFIKELNDLYNFGEKVNNEIDVPGLQYSDFSLMQNQQIKEGKLKENLAYWSNCLKGYDFKTTINTTGFLGIESETKLISINSQISNSVQQACRKKDISLFMLLLTVFAETIGEIEGEEDFLVGSYIAGREYTEIESLVGCFVNILPLRINGLNNDHNNDNLLKIRKTCIDGYKNQVVPIKMILDEFGIETKKQNVIDKMFVLQNNSVDQVKLGKAKMESVKIRHVDAPFPLQCSVFINGALDIAFTFHKSKYSEELIEKMMQHFKNRLSFYENLLSK